MHYPLEIIMPPTEDIEKAVEQILEEFSEHDEENRHSFWDWWVIGGRFSGIKLQASLNKKSLHSFWEELKKEKITVGSFVAGKEDIKPESQIPKVDALWRKHFPNKSNACPFFSHYDEKNDESVLTDIIKLKDLPKKLSASHVIIAGKNHEGVFSATNMFQKEIWNGVSYEETKWDGKVSTALESHISKIKTYKEVAPKEDWLVVTVDYHN
jgi:hypothetical protein